MNRVFSIIAMTMIFFTGTTYSTIVTPSNAEEHSVPSYAKWGRMAMKETMEKYPDAQIIDYLHVGKKSKGENKVEQFKLWLKESGKEFGVFIDIEFHPETEKVISIRFRESD